MNQRQLLRDLEGGRTDASSGGHRQNSDRGQRVQGIKACDPAHGELAPSTAPEVACVAEHEPTEREKDVDRKAESHSKAKSPRERREPEVAATNEQG